jgi:hypothetical protein
MTTQSKLVIAKLVSALVVYGVWYKLVIWFSGDRLFDWMSQTMTSLAHAGFPRLVSFCFGFLGWLAATAILLWSPLWVAYRRWERNWRRRNAT